MRASLCLMLTVLVGGSSTWAGGEESEDILLQGYLVAGPMRAPLPAFYDQEEGKVSGWLLEQPFLDLKSRWPKKGAAFLWPAGNREAWRAMERFEAQPGEGGAQIAYLVGYLRTPRRQTIELNVASRRPLAVYCDGKRMGMSESTLSEEKDPAATRVKLDLVTGKHMVVIKTVNPPDRPAGPWGVEIRMILPAETALHDRPEWSLEPRRTFARLDELGALERISGLALSPDGAYLAAQRSRRGHERAQWIEILHLPDGEREQVLRMGRSTHSPRWSPDGIHLAFRTGSSLWLFNSKTKSLKEILHEENGLGAYFWGPGGRSIYFFTRQKKPSAGDYERIWDPRDRLTDWDEEARLDMVTLNGACRRSLTAIGDFAVTQGSVSPDGTRMVLVRRVPLAERPFFESEFWLMEMGTGDLRLIRKIRFPFENGPAHLAWSPDGRRIAFTAPPGETKVSGGEEHNAFDTCLYTLDIVSGDLVRISDRFGESVAGSLWWLKGDDRIYFIAQQRAKRRVARIDPDGDGGLEFLTRTPSDVSVMAPAAGGGSIAFSGTSIDHPVRVYLMDFETGESRLILDPNEGYMSDMILGKRERFDFTNEAGDPIDGWIFYPPDFDERRSYPLVVYYYGGTEPRKERFDQLNYHWISANGYVVYVVNPTGAVGHTHAFSDKHCNDWGAKAGRDIIEGTKRVLEKKPFIDSKRVGCFGGSYGGFMTLHLAAETDLFRAGCSMYGIANIASYWGAGIWGYTYGDTALGGSYPWSRPDIFVDRSPLFRADRIKTALLLLHGLSDVNVPSVESEQMFTALKVLGKDVAYVRFANEDHGIAGKFSNLIAHRAMILEWFDKHLKDQPEGWNRRWKEK